VQFIIGGAREGMREGRREGGREREGEDKDGVDGLVFADEGEK